jgi:acetyl-CoA carboxylase biotin carboxylase subunit
MRLHRVFVANRGEIAVRIIRTCRQLGIETVLGASEADLDSMAARLADRVICIGAAAPSASYLNVDAVVNAAMKSGAQAIHPGYGFLSENPKMAAACAARGIVFIGPTQAQLLAVGDKLRARQMAVDAGLPVVSGGPVADLADAHRLAKSLGWPVLIKATGGGGGRGMKPVRNGTELETAMHLATAEAHAAFGDARVYLEQMVLSGRHVEVQVLGDGADVIHLGTRDCSVQRRYQKLVEEAPAPGLSVALRRGLHEAGVTFARHLGYRGLGTVEFLVDRQREAFYFLEMNARIQVEHPVTELICGLDLVAEQIAVAEGAPLRLRQEDVTFNGHAIECRVNAEDWTHGFRPDPGTVTAAAFPAGEGVRVDTHIQSGAVVPPNYDSLLAKLIVHGRDRTDAIARMRRALQLCRIKGVMTNVPMHEEVMAQPEFMAGGVDTDWLAAFLDRRLEAG